VNNARSVPSALSNPRTFVGRTTKQAPLLMSLSFTRSVPPNVPGDVPREGGPRERRRKKKMPLLDSLSALSAARGGAHPSSYIIAAARCARVNRRWQAYVYTYTLSQASDERIVRAAAITGDGANVRTMDRFDGCAREEGGERVRRQAAKVRWRGRAGCISRIYIWARCYRRPVTDRARFRDRASRFARSPPN